MPGARTQRVTDPVQSRSSRTGERRRAPRLPLVAAGAIALAVLWAGGYTPAGRFVTAFVFVVLDYYMGVVCLVALSVTVMVGLLSTDRILLAIGHRVLLQGVHRATSVIAVVALGIHIAVKVLSGHAGLGDVVLPFFSQGRSLFIGFGTIASYLLFAAFWSGLARARFAVRARPWLWRVLHCAAYLSWLVALGHGLNAGRPAPTWVTLSYSACVVGVALALLVRLYTKFGRYATGVKPARAIGVNTQTAVMPRFQDGFMPGRTAAGSPVGSPAVAGSPVGAASPAGAWSPAGTGSPVVGPAHEYRPGQARYQDGWADPPERGYPAGRHEPPVSPARPRLRLVTSEEPSTGRHAHPDDGGADVSGWDRPSGEAPQYPGGQRPGPYPPAPPPQGWGPGRPPQRSRWSPHWQARRSTRHSPPVEDYRAG